MCTARVAAADCQSVPNGESDIGRRLAIMLGMVKMTYPEIRQAVLAVEDDKLEENLLVQLSNYVPTPEEVRLHHSKRGFKTFK